MIRKLSEIPGLNVSKMIQTCGGENPQELGVFIGYNKTIEEQSSRQIEVVIDREALATLIWKSQKQIIGSHWDIHRCEAIADTIISQQDSIMEIRVKEDK